MINLSGQKIGLLTVKAPCCRLDASRKRAIYWCCDCECGTRDHLVGTNNLHGKRLQQSCGCMKGSVTHGHHRGRRSTSTYQSWRGMKERCLSPKHQQWQNYGGRGIKITDRWLGKNGYQNFLQDMGERPSSRHSLDRRDANGNYCPENCKWSTATEQGRNKRCNKLWIFQGETLCETALTEKYGLNLRTFRHRIDLGWSLKDALTKPVKKRHC